MLLAIYYKLIFSPFIIVFTFVFLINASFFQNNIFRNTQRLEDLKSQMNWDQKALEAWLEESARKDEDALTLQKYTRSDEGKVKVRNPLHSLIFLSQLLISLLTEMHISNNAYRKPLNVFLGFSLTHSLTHPLWVGGGTVLCDILHVALLQLAL